MSDAFSDFAAAMGETTEAPKAKPVAKAPAQAAAKPVAPAPQPAPAQVAPPTAATPAPALSAPATKPTREEFREQARKEFAAGRSADFWRAAKAAFVQGVSPWSDESEGAIAGTGNYLGDRLASAVHGLQPGPSLADEYRAARDARREANADAALASPTGYAVGLGAGNVVGAVPQMLSPAVAASPILASAAMGGAAGLGASPADLTRGEVLPAARDAATSALLGANAAAFPSAVVNVAKGSAARELSRNVDELLSGVMKAKKDKALDTLKRNTGEGVPPSALATLSDDEIRAAALADMVDEAGGRAAVGKITKREGLNLREDPQVLPLQVGARKSRVGKEIGATYEGADVPTMPLAQPGVPLSKAVKAIEDLAEAHGKGTATSGALKAYAEHLKSTFAAAEDAVNVPMGELKKRFVAAGGDPKIPATDLKKYWTQANQDPNIPFVNLWSLQKEMAEKGFGMEGKYFFDPTARARMGRDIAGKFRGLLQEGIEGITPGGKERLQGLNERYSSLAALEQIAQSKALKAATPSRKPSLSAQMRLQSALAMLPAGGIVGGVLGHAGLGVAAGAGLGAAVAGKKGLVKADSLLARALGERMDNPATETAVRSIANQVGKNLGPLTAQGQAGLGGLGATIEKAFRDNVETPIAQIEALGGTFRESDEWAIAHGVPIPTARSAFERAREARIKAVAK